MGGERQAERGERRENYIRERNEREMGVMNKMLLVVALLMAVVVSAMAVTPIDPFPFPLPDGCIGLKCRKGCGEYRRLNRGPGELQSACNVFGLNYSILRGEGFNRCFVRCSGIGTGNTAGVSTLRCDTPPFIRRFSSLIIRKGPPSRAT